VSESRETSAMQAPGQQIPAPVVASVRVEFADGSFREFCVHKPLRADVTIAHPIDHRLGDLTADLGALPVGAMMPTLPEVAVRLKAGLAPHGQVITIDSREADPAGTAGRLLALLAEAFDLRETGAADDLWRGWERKTGAFLGGE